mmetsp:Transcript_63447/g.200435  ORF Transcript_63447/g.200435 Transcript_63447/m.200435 type:complete len:87 (+) Transcript_63447:121-381(+)
MCGNDLLACICAYFIPPLGVFWDLGCGWEVIVCTILTFCGYVPGVVFAVCMIGCKEPASGRELPDTEKGGASGESEPAAGYVKVAE